MLFALNNIPHEQSDKIVYLEARNFIDKLSYIQIHPKTMRCV